MIHSISPALRQIFLNVSQDAGQLILDVFFLLERMTLPGINDQRRCIADTLIRLPHQPPHEPYRLCERHALVLFAVDDQKRGFDVPHVPYGASLQIMRRARGPRSRPAEISLQTRISERG